MVERSSRGCAAYRMVATAGGVSLGSDNSYPDIDDAEESLPMPRAEIRAGYRIVNVMEITGFVGAERRLYWNRDNETRMFVGVSFGTGADVDPRQ
ncbi:MAG: hypothetical protein HOW73_42350 [Polyangiaceae bacterium]|nr:hypothetical protein [Polyangiaceae bacterium]